MQEKEKEYTMYSEVEQKEVEWLWYPYIPKGMVTILQGDPKCGKTFMLIDLIARITKGDKKPFSEECFEIGTVILQNNDDPVEYTLLPRLNKQGADVSKVAFVNEDDKKLMFSDLKRLEETIKEVNPTLIVIDPIQAFMGKADPNAQVQVRNSLAPLKIIVEKYGCSIVLVQHLKKGNEAKSIYKGAGSIDFVGFARSTLMVFKNPEDKAERMLIHTTSNVAKEGHCLSYRISDAGLLWCEDKGELDADDLLSQEVDTKFENAKHFIWGCVASKYEVSAGDLQKLQEVGNFSETTFNKARSSLSKHEIITKVQHDNKWWWRLKATHDKVQSDKVEIEVKENE